jgi:hypothetical protein
LREASALGSIALRQRAIGHHRTVEESHSFNEPATLHRGFSLGFPANVRPTDLAQFLLAHFEGNRVHVTRVAFARNLL